MSEVDGRAVEACATQDAGGFLRLLVGVVALLAQRLPVALIPEQFDVALVRLDVVDHVGRHHLSKLSVHAAQRMRAQELHARPAPCSVVEVVVLAHERRRARRDKCRALQGAVSEWTWCQRSEL